MNEPRLLAPFTLFPPLPPPAPRSTGSTAQPAVAVITRTKNRALLLKRACASVLGQSFSDWVHVIVNDGGATEAVTDAVSPLLAEYGTKVIELHHPSSLGMEAASNSGIQKSSSRYLAFLDDDDSWDPEFLREAVSFLDQSPVGQKCAGVVCQTVVVREDIQGDTVREVSREDLNPTLQNLSLGALVARNRFTNNSFVVRRSVWEAVGGFNEQLPVMGDWEFNLRVALSWEIGVIPKKLAFYHHRVDQTAVAFGNTVIAGRDSHLMYDALLKNQLLRDELKGATPSSLGLIALYGGMIEDLNDQVRALSGPSAGGGAMASANSGLGEMRAQVDTIYRALRKIFRPLLWLRARLRSR